MRMDKAAAAPEPAEGGEAPGYDIEEFDRIPQGICYHHHLHRHHQGESGASQW